MIEDDRENLDVVTQVAAVRAALARSPPSSSTSTSRPRSRTR
jgi:hypothetical protein